MCCELLGKLETVQLSPGILIALDRTYRPGQCLIRWQQTGCRHLIPITPQRSRAPSARSEPGDDWERCDSMTVSPCSFPARCMPDGAETPRTFRCCAPGSGITRRRDIVSLRLLAMQGDLRGSHACSACAGRERHAGCACRARWDETIDAYHIICCTDTNTKI